MGPDEYYAAIRVIGDEYRRGLMTDDEFVERMVMLAAQFFVGGDE